MAMSSQTGPTVTEVGGPGRCRGGGTTAWMAARDSAETATARPINTGGAIRSSAFGGVSGVAERLKCGVQSLSAAPDGLVIGFGGDVPDELVQIIVAGRQDRTVVAGTDREHQPLAVGIQQPQLAQRRGYLVRDDDLADLAGEGELSPAQVERRSGQLLMTPSSPQTLHCQRIGAGGSVRSTLIRPGQRRLPGRRRHGSAVSQAVPASPAVAALTMLLRWSASRRAGPGVSSGRSRKWFRSVTNISQEGTGWGLTRCRRRVSSRRCRRVARRRRGQEGR